MVSCVGMGVADGCAGACVQPATIRQPSSMAAGPPLFFHLNLPYPVRFLHDTFFTIFMQFYTTDKVCLK